MVSRSGLRSCYFGHGGHDGAWGEYGFLWGNKPKELHLKPVQLKLLAKVKENSEAQNFNAILCNPCISSAMAMAMDIYRTLCVLVWVRSCLLITLIKCLKGLKSLGFLFNVKNKSTLYWLSDKATYWAVCAQLNRMVCMKMKLTTWKSPLSKFAMLTTLQQGS